MDGGGGGDDEDDDDYDETTETKVGILANFTLNLLIFYCLSIVS